MGNIDKGRNSKMTKQEAENKIRKVLNLYGFKTSAEYSMSGLPEPDNDGVICITVSEKEDRILTREEWERGSRRAVYRISASAHIRQMGGSPSPDELLAAADEITRAARCVKAFDAMDITYTE